MKRYRVFLSDLDSTGALLNLEVGEDWDEQAKEMYRENHDRLVDGMRHRYGSDHFEAKYQNLADLGGQAFSINAYHNRFYRQSRHAFVMGAYYPALTGACTLGERILNHLVLGLRDSYRKGTVDSAIYRKQSFENWNTSIGALATWRVFLPGVEDAFRSLASLRQRAVHFSPQDPVTEENVREIARTALRLMDDIIETQFGAFGPQPWFIPVPGAAFIRKYWETNPFVRLLYLPNCLPVGPHHEMEWTGNGWMIHDQDYDNCEITDEEFVCLYQEASQQRFAALRHGDETAEAL